MKGMIQPGATNSYTREPGQSPFPDKKSLQDTVKWYLGFTAIGGLTHASNTEFKLNKVVWILLTLAGGALTVWNVYNVVKDYLEKDVTTTISNYIADKVEFPAVTICPLNKVNCFYLTERIKTCSECSDETKTILCQLYNLGLCMAVNQIQEKLKYGAILEAEDVCPESDAEPIPRGRAAALALDILFSQLSLEDQLAVTQPAESLIKECSYRSRITDSCRSFQAGKVPVVSPKYGICHSFNYFPRHHKNNFTMEESRLSGEVYGLTLVLNIDSKHYMLNGIAENEGVKVIIHDPKSLPSTSSDGYIIKTATVTNLAIERDVYRREPDPYPSSCVDDWGSLYEEGLAEFPYSQLLCQSRCIDLNIQDMCQCALKDVMDVYLKDAPLCDMSPKTVRCITALENFFIQADTNTCYCDPLCYEIMYRVSLSSATWPSNFVWPYLAEKYGIMLQNKTVTEKDMIGMFLNESISDEDIAGSVALARSIQMAVNDDFAKVNVYYKTMRVKSVTEKAKYDADSLLSSLGGAFSLYLGITIVSLFEVFELCTVLCRRLVHKNRRSSEPPGVHVTVQSTN